VACSLSKDLTRLVLEILGEPMAFSMPIEHPLLFLPGVLLKMYVFYLRAKRVKRPLFYLCLVLTLTVVLSLDIVMAKVFLRDFLTVSLDNPQDS